jgi:hypothetical protein
MSSFLWAPLVLIGVLGGGSGDCLQANAGSQNGDLIANSRFSNCLKYCADWTRQCYASADFRSSPGGNPFMGLVGRSGCAEESTICQNECYQKYPR